jgi:selenocysteine-specific elongation factor
MLAGVLSIDRVLLIVAADDGPRPQTLEHLDILELIGVAEVTGVVTKIDRVEPDRTLAVVEEVKALLGTAGYAGSPVFPVSSRSGEGIAALTRHLHESARLAERQRAAAPPSGLFRMPIDRAFSLPGIGLVVTGTVAAGAVTVGDRLLVSPSGLAVRVRRLHSQNRAADSVAAGERCAVNIVGSFPEGSEPGRGDWLLAPERHSPARRLDLLVRASRFAEVPLRDGLPVHLHLGTADIVGRVAVLGARAIPPGDSDFVQVDIEHPTGALYGDRAVLRDHAARHTLAGGHVVDPFPPRRGRRLPARLAVLQAAAASEPGQALSRLLEVEGLVDLSQFALARNLKPTELAGLAEDGGFQRLGPVDGGVAVTAARLGALGEAIVAALGAFHQAQPDTLGPTRPALLAQLRTVAPEPALEAALAELAAAGRAVREGGMWRLPDHRPRLTQADERLWARVQPLLEAGELRPPRVRELAAELALDPHAVERLLHRAERLGRVAKVADNRFFLPQSLARLAGVARELAEESPVGTFTAAIFKDRSGIGRNLTIQVLEHLDRMGVTRRQGDARIILREAEVLN